MPSVSWIPAALNVLGFGRKGTPACNMRAAVALIRMQTGLSLLLIALLAPGDLSLNLPVLQLVACFIASVA